MEELELFDTPMVDAASMGQLLLHLAINLIFCGFIIHKLYLQQLAYREILYI